MTGPISATTARRLLLADQQRRAAPADRRHGRRPTRPSCARSSPRTRRRCDSASIVGDRLIASYLVDAKSEVRTFTLAGRRTGTIRPARHRQRRRLLGRPVGDSETFYSASPASTGRRPSTATTARPAKAASSPQPELAFDPARYEVRQVFYASNDGTRVPMFLVHRRDLDRSRPQPTLLYGYGGFNVSPSCRASSRAG